LQPAASAFSPFLPVDGWPQLFVALPADIASIYIRFCPAFPVFLADVCSI
jgi:hypothetical protein